MRELVINQVHRRNNAADRPHPEILNANPDGAVFKRLHRLCHFSLADLWTLAAVCRDALDNHKSPRPLKRSAVAADRVQIHNLAIILESHARQSV